MPEDKPAAKETPPPLRSPKERSGVMAETVVNSFVETLKAEASRRGGTLMVADLDNLKSEFASQITALTSVFEDTFDAFAKAREMAELDRKRDLPFDRIVIKQFSHLFAERNGFDRITRRILPGFSLALNMMLGAEAVEECQENCRLIVSRMREEKGDVFDWDDVYTSKEIGAIVLDTQVKVAAHFSDYEKRREWFMELINNHLTSVQDLAKDDAEWKLMPGGVKNFLNALLGSLKVVVETDAGKVQIAKRHGADTTDAVCRVLRCIE
ncbi:MAG: hypothetical protein VX990_02455 [Pseudomonadota bacterium]|nr:hypothetical protein [Pseudomonadota bacterium]